MNTQISVRAAARLEIRAQMDADRHEADRLRHNMRACAHAAAAGEPAAKRAYAMFARQLAELLGDDE